jgi:putative acetyltransferase
MRPLKDEDWRDRHEIWRAPRVLWATPGLPSRSEDEVHEKVENPPPNMHRFGAVVDSKTVGVAALGIGSYRCAHVGYASVAVHDEYQQRGLGTALMSPVVDLADGWLNLRCMELEDMVDSEAALRLYRRFGFECEGRKLQDIFRGGELVDTFIIGLLREEE